MCVYVCVIMVRPVRVTERISVSVVLDTTRTG